MDVFYPTSNEPDGAPPAETDVAGGVALSADVPGNETAAPDGAGPAGPTDTAHTADIARWQTWLEQNGFSQAEASRLIFERLRPRDEGTTRS